VEDAGTISGCNQGGNASLHGSEGGSLVFLLETTFNLAFLD
jgi:hypothetical protein